MTNSNSCRHATLRAAVRSLLATPRESPAFARRSRLARRILAQHPEVRERPWRYRLNGQQQRGG